MSQRQNLFYFFCKSVLADQKPTVEHVLRRGWETLTSAERVGKNIKCCLRRIELLHSQLTDGEMWFSWSVTWQCQHNILSLNSVIELDATHLIIWKPWVQKMYFSNPGVRKTYILHPSYSSFFGCKKSDVLHSGCKKSWGAKKRLQSRYWLIHHSWLFTQQYFIQCIRNLTARWQEARTGNRWPTPRSVGLLVWRTNTDFPSIPFPKLNLSHYFSVFSRLSL